MKVTPYREDKVFGARYACLIEDDGGSFVELDEDEIIELAGVTARLAAKIQQRRAGKANRDG